MPRAIKGTLVTCDSSIRALILKIDSASRSIVIEELDDTHLLVDQSQVQFLKNELNKLLSENTYNPLEDENAPQ